MMKKQHGFNLVELLVVVAIIGIIGAFAYPSYLDNVRSSKRSECATNLMGLGNAMERFYTVNSTYRGAAAAGADTGAPAVYTTRCPADGSTQTYALTIQAANASTYALQAAPVNDQVNDKCGTLTLTNTGLKGVAGADPGVTWQQCWR